MADTLSFSGSVCIAPAVGYPSGQTDLGTPICEQLSLIQSFQSNYTLSSDSPVTVNFAGLASAAFWFVKVTGGEVNVTITSAAGTAQVVPVDSLQIGFSRSVPITAMTLTRTPGTTSLVNIILGQSA
ncbi:MAG TPA: hypothetical protein VLV86_03460 [Vicinamibacterales bacterium]|nr:hypothetical protein [Vicinamibacterales bacterium]